MGKLTQQQAISLAQTIGGLGSTDSTATLFRAYQEVTENLAKLKIPPLVETSGLAVTTTPFFDFPSEAVQVLGIFHEGVQLRPARTMAELEAYDPDWRDSSSSPIAYYVDETDFDVIRMVPYPTTATTGAWIYTRAPSIGAELVSDGEFDTGTPWSTGNGWAIAGGVATCDGTQPSASDLYQATTGVEAGKTYQVTFTLSSQTAGTITPYLGTAAGTARNTTGTYEENLTHAGVQRVIFTASSDFVGDIDDVSVREIFTIPDWMAMYVVFHMLEHEYNRLSDHHDKEFANNCGLLAEIFAMLIGL